MNKIQCTNILAALLITGCASMEAGSKKTYSETTNEVFGLLELHRFNEARTVIRGQGAMCNGYNRNGLCTAGEYENAEVELENKIDFAQKCDAAISVAEGEKPRSLDEANEVKAQLHRLCKPPEFSDNWIISLPDGYKARIAAVDDLLGAKFPAWGSANPMILAKQRCEAGMRWAYIFQKRHSDANYVVVDDRSTRSTRIAKMDMPGSADAPKLKGDFLSADKCEEARLTDPNAASDGTFLNRCRERYVGDTIQITVAKMDILSERPMFPTKKTVYFSSLEKCQATRIKGYENQIDDSLAEEFRKIAPVGGEARPRFIGPCAELQQVICKPDSNEPQTVRLLE